MVVLKQSRFIYCTACLISLKDLLSLGYCAYKSIEFLEKSGVDERAPSNL